jgi:DNA-directed RNA polymerase specialized sigma24 family protein
MDQQIAIHLSEFNRLVLACQDEAYTFAWYLLGNEALAEAAMREAVEISFHIFSLDHADCHLLLLRQVVKRYLEQETSDFNSDEPFSNLRFLPEPEKIILVLIDILGRSYTDASHITGSSIKDIGRLLTQARRRMMETSFIVSQDTG